MTATLERVALQREWSRAVDRMTPERLEVAAGIGIGPAEIEVAGGIGLGYFWPDGRLYLPDPTGVEALLFPVYAPAPPVISARWRQPPGRMVDLLAINAEVPERWWLRSGRANRLNGLASAIAEQQGQALVLHSSPLGWLRAGCAGDCLLEQSHRFRAHAHRGTAA